MCGYGINRERAYWQIVVGNAPGVPLRGILAEKFRCLPAGTCMKGPWVGKAEPGPSSTQSADPLLPGLRIGGRIFRMEKQVVYPMHLVPVFPRQG